MWGIDLYLWLGPVRTIKFYSTDPITFPTAFYSFTEITKRMYIYIHFDTYGYQNGLQKLCDPYYLEGSLFTSGKRRERAPKVGFSQLVERCTHGTLHACTARLHGYPKSPRSICVKTYSGLLSGIPLGSQFRRYSICREETPLRSIGRRTSIALIKANTPESRVQAVRAAL